MSHDLHRLVGLNLTNSHRNLIVHKYSDDGLPLCIKAKTESVEAWSGHDDDGAVFLPEEVIRAGVYRLNFPRHHILVLEVP